LGSVEEEYLNIYLEEFVVSYTIYDEIASERIW